MPGPRILRWMLLVAVLSGAGRASPGLPRPAQEGQRASDVSLLAMSLKADELIQSQRDLWPRRPHMVPGFERWLEEAEVVLLREEAVVEAARRRTRLAEARPADPVAQWWVGEFTELQEYLARLHRYREEMRERVVFAESVLTTTVHQRQAEWDAARAAIAASDRYDGFDMPEVVGIVPLEPDPVTGLWEFLHVESGTAPQRDAETGRWIIGESTGVVLVLIPGGKDWCGAQKSDPAGPNYDLYTLVDLGPVEVDLPPYLLAKYELTQGQWLRIAGENPSQYQPGAPPLELEGGPPLTLAHPVEVVTWRECRRMLFRCGMAMPTPEQWEYACRAGTDTPWWTGAEPTSLGGAANVCDSAYEAAFPEGRSTDTWLDDGFVVHAPVGSFAPNPFGLFDTLGNVFEWVDREGGSNSHIRGGGFVHSVVYCRSSTSFRRGKDYSSYYVGVRPILPLQ